MSASSALSGLARGVVAVGASVEALDRGVRAHRGALPLEVVRGWDDFRARWRAFAASVATLDPGRLEADLSTYARHVARWLDAMRRWGVLVDAVQVGFDGLITPSRARARMDGVEASVATLDERIRARRVQLGDGFVRGWARWRDAWRRFYRGYPRAWDWWYLGNGSAWNETLVYQERLGQWRRAAERAGVRFSTPAPQSAPERRPGGDWVGGARDIAVAGAIGAVALGAVYLVSKVA